MTYSHLGSCGNHQISANYVVNNLVMCENRVNTHAHTFSSRVFYRKYLRCQRVSKSVFSDFAAFSSDLYLRNGAPPLCVAVCEALHHHIRRYQSALIMPCWKRRIFISTINTKTNMTTEGMKRYERPRMNVINLEIAQMIVTSGDVTVGGWGNGGSLGGGEAEESASRRGEWGNLWYNN